MTVASTFENIRTGRRSVPLLLLLITAGLTGNHFPFSILNAHFVFGSLFAMLALQLLGWGRGVIAAAAIAAYTYFAWNHPWALVTMTAEAAVVGWLFTRRRVSLAAADLIYWLIVGIPLGYFCFRFFGDLTAESALFLMTKQATNGIANALAARLLFAGFGRRWSAERITLRETLANLLTLFVLVSCLILVALAARDDLAETDRRIRADLLRDNRHVTAGIQDWLAERETAIVYLASLAAKLPPSQMQARLEQAAADRGLLRTFQHDRRGIAVAFFPKIDELGRPTIGKSFADRPYWPLLRQSPAPLLTETMPSRFDRTGAVSNLLMPVTVDGAFMGVVGGVLNIDRLAHFLETHATGEAVRYTLVDRHGNVIFSNRDDQKVMTPFSMGKGSFETVAGRNRASLPPLLRGRGSPDDPAAGIKAWMPELPQLASTIDLWGKSVYVMESTVGGRSEWRLILEQPVAPFQKRLYAEYAEKFLFLFAVLALSLALAGWASRRTLAAVEGLGLVTRELPARIAAGETIAWPESRILETHRLIANAREMADSLRSKFSEIREMNVSLELRVAEKTQALIQSENSLREVLENLPAMVFMKEADSLRFVLFNRTGEELLGSPREALLGKSDHDLFPKEEADFFAKKDREALSGGQVIDIPEEFIQTRHRGRRILHTRKIPLCDAEGRPRFLLGISLDITEEKQNRDALQEAYRKLRAGQTAALNLLEDLKAEIGARKQKEAALQASEVEIRRLNAELEQRIIERTAQLEASNKELEAFSYSVSHDLRAPLRAVDGYANILTEDYAASLDDEGQRVCSVISESARTMGRLIDDLLTLSRTGRAAMQQASMDMTSLVQKVFLDMTTPDQRQRIDFRVGDLPVAEGDPTLLRQVWVNLLSNAVKFSGKRERAVIEVGSWPAGRGAQGSGLAEDGATPSAGEASVSGLAQGVSGPVYFVRDNGAGFDMAYADKLFGVFQRLHSAREYPGTGVGLAIVQRIVQRHGGHVWVEGETGQGATFYFTLGAH